MKLLDWMSKHKGFTLLLCVLGGLMVSGLILWRNVSFKYSAIRWFRQTFDKSSVATGVIYDPCNLADFDNDRFVTTLREKFPEFGSALYPVGLRSDTDTQESIGAPEILANQIWTMTNNRLDPRLLAVLIEAKSGGLSRPDGPGFPLGYGSQGLIDQRIDYFMQLSRFALTFNESVDKLKNKPLSAAEYSNLVLGLRDFDGTLIVDQTVADKVVGLFIDIFGVAPNECR